MTGAAGSSPDDAGASDLVPRATALYALALDRFIGERNGAAAEAKRAGDRDLAALIRALPKPSSSAWLVNVLVARRRAEVEQVIELGASLEEAQSGTDRAQLQALGQQRQRLLAAVARESLAAASEAGHDVGPAALPGVEQTLRAALADPAAAAAVLSGRLVRTLEASGWDAVDLAGAVAGPFHPPDAEGTDPDDTDDTGSAASEPHEGDDGGRADARSTARAARRRKQAEAALAAATASLAAAEAAAAEARREVERTRVRHAELTTSAEELEQKLAVLRRELTDLTATLATLTERAEEADDELVEAREDEEAARANLE